MSTEFRFNYAEGRRLRGIVFLPPSPTDDARLGIPVDSPALAALAALAAVPGGTGGRLARVNPAKPPMNDHEAKFLLHAYRPDGSDAQDPIFAEALAQTKKSPALRAWLDREVAFDGKITAKLRDLPPPAGLREAILAGGRASVRRRAWWRNPLWPALAASIALALIVIAGMRHRGPSAQEFAAFALTELATARAQHGGGGPATAQMQAQLTASVLPLPGNVRLDPGELRRAGCHTVNFAGHEVFEICFERDGTTFHLYAARASDLAAGAALAQTQVVTKGNFAATAWKDGRFAYALVTDGGTAALRRLI